MTCHRIDGSLSRSQSMTASFEDRGCASRCASVITSWLVRRRASMKRAHECHSRFIGEPLFRMIQWLLGVQEISDLAIRSAGVKHANDCGCDSFDID